MISYWERKEWFSDVDFTIVGSGIVGLNCALRLREKHPKSKILLLERGRLPQGASTKNAGFACFGSVSEMLDDLNKMSESSLVELIKKRVDGLQLLRDNLGDKNIGLELNGGYELFLKEDESLYHKCIDGLDRLNQLLFPIFKNKVFSLVDTPFGMQEAMAKAIFNPYEGQIDTGMMMTTLLRKAAIAGIKILNSTRLERYEEEENGVHLYGEQFDYVTQKLLVATNGFATDLLDLEMKPARAQVLITEPIKDLEIKGTFHLDEGYYYFRNIDDRILLGGGRNLDFDGETTSNIGLNQKIQDHLDFILKSIILPHLSVKVDQRWAGIMGVGQDKNLIVKHISTHVYCGVKMGGMGIAIGSKVGQELADLL